MQMKKILVIVLASSAILTSTFSSIAAEKTLLESLPDVQYDAPTWGSAEAIPKDDYLLDGNYENGELINGSIYHSEEEAIEGVKQDQIVAKAMAANKEIGAERVYPNTGIIEGISSEGSFFYNIQSSGRTAYPYSNLYDTVTVNTQSDVYVSKTDTIEINEDYSYIVTVMSGDTAVGSFRGYANDVNGGVKYTIPGDSLYVKLATENFPRGKFLHGAGSIIDKR